jgi:hypothetical protein
LGMPIGLSEQIAHVHVLEADARNAPFLHGFLLTIRVTLSSSAF